MKVIETMSSIGSFFCVGINHKTACPSVFNQLEFNKELLQHKLRVGKGQAIHSVMLMHTCNRIELYGVGDEAIAQDLLRQAIHCNRSIDDCYFQKQGEDAVMYIMHVASALHSKLIGDAEILGQFKKGAKQAKEAGWINGFMERLINKCIECAKDIRTTTSLVGGQSSLSHAAVKLVKQHNHFIRPNFLIIGTGSLGRSVAISVRKNFPSALLTVTNRTPANYADLISKYQIQALPFEDLYSSLNAFDILISAIGGNVPKVRPSMLESKQQRLLLDLSVPSFFQEDLQELEHTRRLTLEDTSALIRQYQAAREESIPQAFDILRKHYQEFISWAYFQRHERHHIVVWSSAVGQSMHTCPFLKNLEGEQKKKVSQKAVGHFAHYVKSFPKKEQTAKTDKAIIKKYLQEHQKPQCKRFCEQIVTDATACTVKKQLK